MTHDELLAEINKTNPIAVYATLLATELVKQEEDYLLKSFKKVGINPLIIIEQNTLINLLKAQLRVVLELCAIQDEATIGDKGVFNSGRNSMRDEIIQAIEKEVK